MKKFPYGARVRVKLPGRRAFYGNVYSEYRDGPGRERLICVDGVPPNLRSGVAYLIRYVTLIEGKIRYAS
jgi:hypothetical protein